MKKYPAHIIPVPPTQVALEACPCCGSEDLHIGWAHALGIGVRCLECGLRTRSFDLPEYSSKGNMYLRLCAKAAEAWNRRAARS